MRWCTLSWALLLVIFIAAKLVPGLISVQFAPAAPFARLKLSSTGVVGASDTPWMTAVGWLVAVALPLPLVPVTATAIVPLSAPTRV